MNAHTSTGHRQYLSLSIALAVAFLWLGNVAYVAHVHTKDEYLSVTSGSTSLGYSSGTLLPARLHAETEGTFYTLAGTITATRHANSNNLNNLSAFLGASGSQTNITLTIWTLEHDNGDVILNTLEGSTYIGRFATPRKE